MEESCVRPVIRRTCVFVRMEVSEVKGCLGFEVKETSEGPYSKSDYDKKRDSRREVLSYPLRSRSTSKVSKWGVGLLEFLTSKSSRHGSIVSVLHKIFRIKILYKVFRIETVSVSNVVVNKRSSG